MEKIKFRVYKDYFSGLFETKEGIIVGETPKFYKIQADDGSIHKKKKEAIDRNLSYKKAVQSLHVRKWERDLNDYGDSMVRWYVKDGDKELGFFEQIIVYKKKRVYRALGPVGYGEGYEFKGYSGTGEVKEVKIKNNLTCDTVSKKYFSDNKPNIEKMQEDKILI